VVDGNSAGGCWRKGGGVGNCSLESGVEGGRGRYMTTVLVYVVSRKKYAPVWTEKVWTWDQNRLEPAVWKGK
jgi:hypothetical protein